MTAAINPQTTDELQRENESLRVRLREVEETLGAIRRGEVDSLFAQTPEGPRVFTLADANTPYRTFVEEMQHGAATISADGTILYCNRSFPALLRAPIEVVLGAAWHTWVADDSACASKNMLALAAKGKARAELVLRAANGTLIPVAIVANPPSAKGTGETCLVITDLTERKQVEAEARKLAAIVESTETDFARKMRATLVGPATDIRSGTEQKPGRREASFRNTAARVAQIASALVIAIGFLALLGWLFDVTFLKSVFTGTVSMKPNTALAFLFAGASSLLATLHRTNPQMLRWRNAAAIAAIVVGALTLFEWVFALDLGIDQLLFREFAAEVGTVYAGRMAPWSALNFVLFGAALLMLDVRSAIGHSISQSFALLGCLPAILSFIGYFFGAANLYGVGLQSHMAVNTDVAFVFLAVAILSARAEREWVRSAAKDYGIAILVVTLAFLVRWLMWPLLGTAIPFLIHWPALIIAAWYGGFRGGFLATLLSAIGTAYFLLDPPLSLVVSNPAEQFGLAFFLLLGTGQSLLLDKARTGERTRIVGEAETIALRAASTYHRSLIEANLDPLVTIGQEGKIIDVNAATEEATGRPRQELIGTDFADYFTEPDKARAGYEQVFHEGSVRNFALEIRHRDGRLIPVLYNASVYRDRVGNVLGVFAAARDISELRRAEKARQESDRSFRVLAESVPQLVWMCQPDGLNIYFNQRWVEYTGLTLEESHGRGWSTPFHPDDKQSAWNAWNQAVATGGEYRIECRLRAADGSYRWFLIKGVPLRDAKGTIVKWFGTCTDIDDLKRAQEELHRVGDYTRSLIEASLDPLVTIGPDGKITDVNAATEAAIGQARAELIGTDFDDYFTEPEKAQRGYEQAFRDGAVRDYPLEIRHRDGHVTPVLYNASVYRDAAGKVIGVFAAARDISERKRAEELLRSNERRFRTIFEKAPVGIAVIDSYTAQFHEVNPRFAQIAGRSREEMAALDWKSITHPEDVQEDLDNMAALNAGKIPGFTMRKRYVRPDGSLVWVQMTIAPFKVDDRSNPRHFCMIEDITERLRLEEQRARDQKLIELERRRLLEMMNVMPVNLCLLAPDFHIPFANKAFEQTFGKSLGRRCFEALFDRDTPCPWCESFRPLQTGQPHRWRFVGPNDRIYDVHDFPFTDSDGSPLILEVELEITEQEKSREALELRVQQRTAQLEAANQELEAFAYSVSHDLRSPLRAIDGFSQILLKEYMEMLPEKPRHYLQVVCDNARQMGRLIDDLLRFSRSSRQSVQLLAIAPKEIVRQCLEELQSEREGRQVEILLADLPECWGDANLLKQVWFNLLSNALKYTRQRAPAKIEIGSEIKDGDTIYFVRDNGVGFDMQYANKLFGVFQRLHSAEEYEGTGIGLALAQRIVKRHGGRIWADAKVDQGATFYFTLGRKPEHA